MTFNPHLSRLVAYYLRDFQVPRSYPGDKSDLHQVGMLGLLKAIQTYDCDKANLNTWAWYWIRSFIRDEISKHRPQGYIEPEAIKNHSDKKILLRQIYDNIDNNKDKEVFVRYISGETSKDIGESWGVSRQSIDQRLHRIQRTMKEKLDDDIRH